ncbi:MAG TPA: DUF2520 domain-containing protein [Puia sp.]|nr:DUF2520 domain-containing protein [Puia sp.]
MKVVILGSGNTATVLGTKILQAGHEILQVVSRQEVHAAGLASELHCGYATAWSAVDRTGELYLVALSDDAVYGLGAGLSLPGKLVVHTAGTVPKEALRTVSGHCGVLYPLQSLRKEIHPFPAIPFLVDALRGDDRVRIGDFARTISGQVREADDAERLKLHLGAVLVNNFSNYLYTLAADFCREEKTDFSLLLPLIQETAGRLSHFAPRDVQTGPAIRGDRSSIERHLNLLSNHNDLRELYSLFTKQIEAYYRSGEIPHRL